MKDGYEFDIESTLLERADIGDAFIEKAIFAIVCFTLGFTTALLICGALVGIYG